jgi:hypothetical protein
MEIDEAQSRMREIQRIMETATLFTLLPGLAAIVGGVLTLLGCGVSYWLLNSYDFVGVAYLPPPVRKSFCLMWLVVVLASMAVNALLTIRAARRRQIALNPRPAQAAMLSLSPCIVVAAVLTFQFFTSGQPAELRYIAPVWMLLYGIGVYSAGLFSVRAPRVLGLAFLLAGILALLAFPIYGVIAVGASFGLLHIAFGSYVLYQQRQAVVPHE